MAVNPSHTHRSIDIYHCIKVSKSTTPKNIKNQSNTNHDITVWNDSTEFLDKFVYPLSGATFLSTYYRTKAVAFLNGGTNRIQNLISNFLCEGDIEELLNQTPSDNISIWLRKKESNNTNSNTEKNKLSSTTTSVSTDRLIQSIRVTEANEAIIGYEAGGSLYFRAPPIMADVFIPALSESLNMGSIGTYYDPQQREPRGEVETFVSRAGHITNWHWDFMENFTIQISGKKRWLLKMSNIHSPLRGATPHYHVNNDVIEQQVKTARLVDPTFQFNPSLNSNYFTEDITEVILGPGDFFYFPAGCWHRVECLEDGISINLSVVGTTWADIGSQAVRTLLWRNDTWRQIIALDPKTIKNSSTLSNTTSSLTTSSAMVTNSKKRSRSKLENEENNQSSDSLSTTSIVPTTTTSTTITPLLFPGLNKLSSLYNQTQIMLNTLKEQVALLQPEHLIPPSALLSCRFDGLPGSDQPGIDNSDNEHEDSDEDEEEKTDQQSGEDGHVAGPGVHVRYNEGQLIIRITDPLEEINEISFEQYAQDTIDKKKIFRLNPLAILTRSNDITNPTSLIIENQNITSYTININFGSDELQSSVRSIIEIQNSFLIPVMDTLCTLSSGALPTKNTLKEITITDLLSFIKNVSSSSSTKSTSKSTNNIEDIKLRYLQSIMRGLIFIGGGTLH